MEPQKSNLKIHGVRDHVCCFPSVLQHCVNKMAACSVNRAKT